MLNTYLNRPRKKAWIGAAIGAAINIASSAFNASKQKKAMQKQYALQRNTDVVNTGISSAANLTQAYANSDELDREFRNRFLYGGRKKAAWGAGDTSALINSLGSAGSKIATSFVGQVPQKPHYLHAIKPIINDNKDNEAIYDSAARSEFLNNYYRTAMMRLGGSKRSRRC